MKSKTRNFLGGIEFEPTCFSWLSVWKALEQPWDHQDQLNLALYRYFLGRKSYERFFYCRVCRIKFFGIIRFNQHKGVIYVFQYLTFSVVGKTYFFTFYCFHTITAAIAPPKMPNAPILQFIFSFEDAVPYTGRQTKLMPPIAHKK